MVQLSKYLKQPPEVNRNLPLLNSLFSEHFSIFGTFQEQANFKKYMEWVKRSPYLMGFLQVLVADIISDDVSFKPIKKESGRNKVIKAEKFWRVNLGREVLEQTLYDFFAIGNGYNWIGALDKESFKKTIDELNLQFKTQQVFELLEDSETATFIKKFRYVPGSTMTIKNNDYEVTEFIQRVGTNYKVFGAKEIIHLKMIPFDGKVYGFAPMESLLAEVYLLWLITQNNVSFFENGGNPDKVFVLPKEIAGSKNHQYLIETLKKYKKVQNRHGNLVFTGDIQIEDLVKAESQMEHKELGLYIVGVLAMFYGIPAGRIPFLVGKAANLGDAGGLADSGYWRKISVWQSKIEEAYNICLFEPYFGVKIHFARGYKQDEVRETQNEMQKTQVAEQRINLGLWTALDAGEYLGIDPEIIEKAQEDKKKRDEELQSGMLNQNLKPQGEVINNPDRNNINARKSDKQKGNQNDK